MGSAGSMPATGTAQKDTGRAGPARDDGWPAPCAEALPSNPHFTDEENQGSECDLSQDASRWLRLPLGCVCIDCIYNQFSHLGPHLWLWALLTGAVPSCSPSSLRSQRLNPPPVWWRPLHAFLGGGVLVQCSSGTLPVQGSSWASSLQPPPLAWHRAQQVLGAHKRAAEPKVTQLSICTALAGRKGCWRVSVGQRVPRVPPGARPQWRFHRDPVLA